jgi:glucose/arabinose dehydrogenase
MRKGMAVLLLLLPACGGGDPAPVDAGEAGLDVRPANSSCLAGASPAAALGLQQVFAGVGNFASPVLMLQEPASAARWYVVQQGGLVYVFDNQANVTARRVFINLTAAIAGASGGEMGLLGMAFHPGWPTNPRVYFSYTAVANSQRVSRIVEYRTLDGGQTADVGTANVILQVNQPESNHNGGNIAWVRRWRRWR